MYEKYVKLRDAKGLTDYRVSVDTGITKSTFTDWKNGRSKPKLDKLSILAKYFGVPITDLLDDATDSVQKDGLKTDGKEVERNKETD